MAFAPSRRAYWRANLRLVGVLLAVWFAVSYGAGILLVDVLDGVRIGGFKLGFWFAQQGAIFVFVTLIAVYVVAMNRLDHRYGLHEEDSEADGESGGEKNGEEDAKAHGEGAA